MLKNNYKQFNQIYCFTYVVTNKSNNCIKKNGINNLGLPLIAPYIIVIVIINVQNNTNIAQFNSSVK